MIEMSDMEDSDELEDYGEEMQSSLSTSNYAARRSARPKLVLSAGNESGGSDPARVSPLAAKMQKLGMKHGDNVLSKYIT